MDLSSISRYVFVDRDGVLNRDPPAAVRQPTELSVLPVAPQAVALLNAAGYDVIVITNQSCVGRGEVSPDMLHRINKRLSSVISDGGGRLERIYVCPHRPEDRCPCRKPLPGLLLLAGRDYNMDLSQTWFVGDSLTDMQAASAAGCRPALVLTGKVTSKSAPLEVPVFDNLLAFARHLMPPNIPTVNEPQAQRG